MSQVLPKSRIVKIEFTMALPISATMEEIEAWVNFETHWRASLDGDNPLIAHDLDAASAPLLTDTGRHIHEHVTDNGDGTHTIRRSLSTDPCWGPSGIEQVMKAGSD